MLTLFGLVFAGFAGAVGTLILLGLRKQREQAALQQKHPEQPWLWRPDWAAGRIDDTNRHTAWAAWLFAGVWNLVSIPAAVAGAREAVQEGIPALYLVLLFPAVGVALAVWAVRSTLRHQRYGVSRFELATTPGTIGRSLAGTVRLIGVVQPAEGFDVVLSCVRRVTTRSGKNSSTTERVLWQEETRVGGSTSRDAVGLCTRIPVAFRIPSDALATDASDSRDQIVWRLTLYASVPGIDYASAFEVPVFRTPDSDRPPTGDETRAAAGAAQLLSEYRPPASSRITVTTNRRGTEIHFPAARNPGAALGATAFTLIWTVVVGVLVYSDAPLLFPLVFGFLDLVLVISTLQLWFGVSRVAADRQGLVLAAGYFYPGPERRVAAADVADVTTAIGMQAGSRPYYDVVVLRKGGKKLTAGRAIRDKREAQWLALTLKTSLGLTALPGESGA